MGKGEKGPGSPRSSAGQSAGLGPGCGGQSSGRAARPVGAGAQPGMESSGPGRTRILGLGRDPRPGQSPVPPERLVGTERAVRGSRCPARRSQSDGRRENLPEMPEAPGMDGGRQASLEGPRSAPQGTRGYRGPKGSGGERVWTARGPARAGTRKSTKSRRARGGREGARAEPLPGHPRCPVRGSERARGPGTSGGEARPHLPWSGAGGGAGARGSPLSPRHLRALRRGKCRSCYSSFHSFPSASRSGRGRGRGFHKARRGRGRVPGGRSPHDAGGVRGAAGPGRSRRAGEPAVPPARKHDHVRAGSSQRQEALKIEQPGLGGGD